MPRRKKSLTCKKRSTSAPAAFHVGVRRSEKQSEECMLGAMKAVAQGLSVYEASRDYGVPRCTLHDHVSGKVVHGVIRGPKPYLSCGEEKELGSYLKHCAKVGYGKTIKDFLCIVESAATDRGLLPSSRT